MSAFGGSSRSDRTIEGSLLPLAFTRDNFVSIPQRANHQKFTYYLLFGPVKSLIHDAVFLFTEPAGSLPPVGPREPAWDVRKHWESVDEEVCDKVTIE
jgi:hypothetical protein